MTVNFELELLYATSLPIVVVESEPRLYANVHVDGICIDVTPVIQGENPIWNHTVRVTAPTSASIIAINVAYEEISIPDGRDSTIATYSSHCSALLDLCDWDSDDATVIDLSPRGRLCVWMSATPSLDDNVETCRAELASISLAHPDRAMLLHACGVALHTRFEQDGQPKDLTEAIQCYQEVLQLQPLGDSDRPSSLYNLAVVYHSRFEHNGQRDQEDLMKAIQYHRDALELRPPGHTHRVSSLGNLAVAFQSRFKHTGQLEDLSEAILLHQETLLLQPHGHHGRVFSLNNLAVALRARFTKSGNPKDLADAIMFHRETLSLRPFGHPDRVASLDNLTVALHTRFDQSGHLDDLSEVIQTGKEALKLSLSADNPGQPLVMGNLAAALHTQFKQTNHLNDLTEAIQQCEKALTLQPSGHPERVSWLNNLAAFMLTRFEQEGKPEDISKAIKCHREALALRPPGHPERASSLSNLGIAIHTRYEQDGQLSDLKESIQCHRQALELGPPGHPERASRLESLAGALLYTSGHPEDLNSCLSLLKTAADDTGSFIKDRLAASLHWALRAHQHHHSQTVNAYETALALFQLCLGVQPTLNAQHLFMIKTQSRARTLAVDAASYAIEIGCPKKAVEMLEQGRVLLWSSLRGLRTPIERLEASEPRLAQRFRNVCCEIEAMAAGWNPRAFTDNGDEFARMVEQKRLCSVERESILAEIRETPGFEGFLRAVPFASLQCAAREGPVILVYCSKRRSDVIIVLADQAPVLVPVQETVEDLATQLVAARAEGGLESIRYQRTLQITLLQLWESIVGPVFEQLKKHGIKHGSRIWWCPVSTLATLPFHAAGPVSKKSQNYASDRYVSSYTPSLSALIESQRLNDAVSGTTRSKPQMLVVGTVDPSMPDVGDEIDAIEAQNPGATILRGEDATSDAVLKALQSHTWVHLACHGVSQMDKPFLSAFKLDGDQGITLQDLVRAKLPNAEFAFLSACHTAEHAGLHDEVLHLAAAMQFCGFRSVVGTMWAMPDVDGFLISKKFYQVMLSKEPDKDDGWKPKYSNAAVALAAAVKELRLTKVSLERWVNYVHIGA